MIQYMGLFDPANVLILAQGDAGQTLDLQKHNKMRAVSIQVVS